jgi:hypothetical protein
MTTSTKMFPQMSDILSYSDQRNAINRPLSVVLCVGSGE